MSIKSFTKNICRDILRTIRAQLLRFKFCRTLCRIKKKYGNRKIVVAFCVSGIAKWKSQHLYDLLNQSGTYRPIIFVYPSMLDFNSKDFNIDSLLENKVHFFKEKGMDVINVWDFDTNQCVISEDIRPDIVFYQQPWDTPPFPLPSEIADYALSFYIPYFLVNNFDLNQEFGSPLHYQIYGHILLNEEFVKFYKSRLKRRHYAGSLLGLGHTIVDALNTTLVSDNSNSIIYAPHFSFPVEGVVRSLTYSTFLENGKLMLEFAKSHPEFNWVFKPHPRLKYELKSTGVWSDNEVDSYYAEWGKIGVVCETSDYVEHFQKSSTMITDCGSFLTEYSCMDKPLIRLYYHKDNLPPNPILEKLYSTFYYAHNNTELQELLEKIICQHHDPNQTERHKEVVRLGLKSNDTSKKIIHYLDSLLS